MRSASESSSQYNNLRRGRAKHRNSRNATDAAEILYEEDDDDYYTSEDEMGRVVRKKRTKRNRLEDGSIDGSKSRKPVKKRSKKRKKDNVDYSGVYFRHTPFEKAVIATGGRAPYDNKEVEIITQKGGAIFEATNTLNK
mmetsp:Transcript_20459/g.14747  ORF Transcript_20459/g.14747 Transcript_20459/m.14747 type:complete len:139 (+) Transcript_20459:1936-2352(+)|eukprot:CAMPEP_0116886842 /NCGR_PEP_ID=MMETSP0463-20121206/20811_1 /TAXON_ID=181622 /ORGANISM="Strombidinopsis sp, Strain SopsisLIS2011" /LENGTH=138 /DNA_ID=CAMNT_0004547905 /DNA_START=590 /DNA_END=1006 /DNA_ORIENTATION=+